MAKLPRCPIPLPDESPLSLLFRAGIANGWRPHLLVSQYISHPETTLGYAVTRHSIFEAISKEMGIEGASGLVYAAVRSTGRSPLLWKGLVVPRAALRLTTAAICPACFAEDEEPYGRSRWDLKLIRSCAQHRIALVDRCCGCGGDIDWMRLRFWKCRCGFDLRLSPQKAATAVEVDLVEGAVISQDSDLLNTAWALDIALARLEAAQSLEFSNANGDRMSILCDAIRTPHAFAARLAPPASAQQPAAARIVFRELLEFQGFQRYGLPIFNALEASGRGAVGGCWVSDLSARISIDQASRIIGS